MNPLQKELNESAISVLDMIKDEILKGNIIINSIDQNSDCDYSNKYQACFDKELSYTGYQTIKFNVFNKNLLK